MSCHALLCERERHNEITAAEGEQQFISFDTPLLIERSELDGRTLILYRWKSLRT
jgi:hypothetical protein